MGGCRRHANQSYRAGDPPGPYVNGGPHLDADPTDRVHGNRSRHWHGQQ